MSHFVAVRQAFQSDLPRCPRDTVRRLPWASPLAVPGGQGAGLQVGLYRASAGRHKPQVTECPLVDVGVWLGPEEDGPAGVF